LTQLLNPVDVRHIMEKTLTVRIPQIVWEDYPRPNEDAKVGDVFDRLEDGTPRQWRYTILLNRGENDNLFIASTDPLKEAEVFKSLDEAVSHCYENKCQAVMDRCVDVSAEVAAHDLCFLQEAINDMMSLNMWSRTEKHATLLEDWRDELMGKAGVSTMQEVRELHARLCGAHNWGLEDEDEDEFSDEEE